MRKTLLVLGLLATLSACAPVDEDDQEVLEDIFDNDEGENEGEVTDKEWALVCEAQDACEALCEVDNDFARRVYETSASREKRHACAQTWADHGDCDLFMGCLEE